ncbi:MAG: peptidylprolyl isomerase [Rhodospirillales bacterium]|jgi:peptidyl-prolyl cis-trans isomerase C|nr:peptidylprolyl isomerase [Rhodospirillales bacterium]
MFCRLSRLISALVVLIPVVTFSLASSPVAAEDDAVAANVNGKLIYMRDVRDSVASLAPEYQQMPFEQLYPHLVERLVTMHLLADDAVRLELDKSEEFLTMLDVLLFQLQERVALTTEIEKMVTDEAVQTFYDEYAASMAGKEEIHARHILVENEADAVKIIADLNGGADFVALAKERSTGPSGPQGGDLGFFGEGQMVPAFQDAAFALLPGQFTQAPVQTQFGWHVIKLEERRAVTLPALNDIKPNIRKELMAKTERDYVLRLQGDAKIERFDMTGAAMAAPMAPAATQ